MERERDGQMPDQTTQAPQPSAALDPRLNDLSNYQQCFACGIRNQAGLQLTFWREGDDIVTEYTVAPQFQGFPGVVHGGILATLLDETLSRTATTAGRWMMTGRLEVRYRMAVPAGRRLRITGRALSARTRMVLAEGEIRLAETPEVVLADARGTFLPLSRDYQQATADQFPELVGFFDL